MTTRAKYECPACSISMELRGYSFVNLACPQCADPMLATSTECSFDDGGDLHFVESLHRYHYGYRSLRTYNPSQYLPKSMNRSEITELIREAITARLLVIDEATTQARLAGEAMHAVTAAQLVAIERTASEDRITAEAMCETVVDKVQLIDSTATEARLTAESLRQSVVDQQRMVSDANNATDSLIKSRRTQSSELRDLSLAQVNHNTAIAELAAKIDNVDAGAAERLDAAEKRIRRLKKTLKELEMSYVEETPVAADAATTTTPALADVAKTVGGAIAEGAVLGLTSQFISEATDMVLSKALEAGMITPALAKSTMFKEGLKFCVPMMMMAAAEYPQCPKREFFSKVGALAVRGQSAQHAAMFTAVAMGYVSGMTALPSAALLSDRLSAAE